MSSPRAGHKECIGRNRGAALWASVSNATGSRGAHGKAAERCAAVQAPQAAVRPRSDRRACSADAVPVGSPARTASVATGTSVEKQGTSHHRVIASQVQVRRCRKATTAGVAPTWAEPGSRAGITARYGRRDRRELQARKENRLRWPAPRRAVRPVPAVVAAAGGTRRAFSGDGSSPKSRSAGCAENRRARRAAGNDAGTPPPAASSCASPRRARNLSIES